MSRLRCPRCGKIDMAAADGAFGERVICAGCDRPFLTPNVDQHRKLSVPEAQGAAPSNKTGPLLISLSIVLGLAFVALLVVIIGLEDTKPPSSATDVRLRRSSPRSASPQQRDLDSAPRIAPPSERMPEPRPPLDEQGDDPKLPKIELPKPVEPNPAKPTVGEFSKEESPKDASEYLARGNHYLEKGDYDRAIDAFNQAIRLDWKSTEAYDQRAIAFKERLKAGPIPGYKLKTIEGFKVLVANAVFEHDDDPVYERKPLEVLESEVRTVATTLPPRAVHDLQRILIWVEWHDDADPDIGRAVAKYYGVAGDVVLFALANHKHLLKANSVEIINMKALTKEHQPGAKHERCVILHELSHAAHFQWLGPNNPKIERAYLVAMDRRLYEPRKDANGEVVVPYARANKFEYFAEMTCAYFDKLHYHPFTREQMQEYDSEGFKLMQSTWESKPRLKK
jgi:tetratricopeptide (TPR) repeat protein